MAEFIAYKKIPRLSRDCVITEKIDGTNAQIYIRHICVHGYDVGEAGHEACEQHRFEFHVGSRNRWLSAEQDNYRFFKWAMEHQHELLQLGPGRHFGEWWGGGIQRGYGLKGDDKRFSLFHVHGIVHKPDCVGVVPTLYEGPFYESAIMTCIDKLEAFGSAAAPGFMDPEGIVIYHVHGKQLFKKTIKGDEKPKGSQE